MVEGKDASLQFLLNLGFRMSFIIIVAVIIDIAVSALSFPRKIQ